MKKTTQIEIPTFHQLILKAIERAVYQATKRIIEGTAILPKQQDVQEAEQVILKLLEENKQLKNDDLQSQLKDIYLFTLAQTTSAMVTLFDDVSTDDYNHYD